MLEKEIVTLQEFFLHTKGVTYLLLVGYLLLFVWFWRYLTDREQSDE
jgi:hypothetical protein